VNHLPYIFFGGLICYSSAALSADSDSRRLKGVDWVSLGFAVPIPQKRCEEQNNQPPCHLFEQVPHVGRMELGRFRYASFQWNIASGYVGQDWTGKERLAFGLAGLGLYRTFGDEETQEVGGIIQPLSGVFGPTHALMNTNLYYRNYFPHLFVELGLEFAAIWNLAMSSEGSSTRPFSLSTMPLQLHISVGPRW
jgi:hypothetical protein